MQFNFVMKRIDHSHGRIEILSRDMFYSPNPNGSWVVLSKYQDLQSHIFSLHKGIQWHDFLHLHWHASRTVFFHVLDIKSHHYGLPFRLTCAYSHTRLSGWSIYFQEEGPKILVKVGTEPYPSNNVYLQCFEIETFHQSFFCPLGFWLLLSISNSPNNEEKSSIIVRLVPNMDHSLVILSVYR